MVQRIGIGQDFRIKQVIEAKSGVLFIPPG